ncbi:MULTISPECIES: 2-amino-4-hydroxy-6-hydroxymethyldihydropteridine diphosphokinase [unclassified Stenotrophomonas]|uniref:2-amino-4-hydroxy-6- hydroxymethyldihydropteridine diphosphokinase n=1 Tax=unclassified Stenotrophomonas TaxID=196198 RepID=UPI0005AF2EC2|nr:2-amino-4-hydroxy-6-hydroxymethyldihydropteridine diphosphokinase [Stenotrophomonas sp. CFBP8980]KIP85923.1 2-amino-4-hydroxy-6-hydroxymethyldihydropteridine pyrophosphokinase [Stenotrophomonas maltophilia]MBD8643629.1 2-amino-4-hydroxy-6-hydroxymethyldihydropteridine diphosphokinase [Stenotrophomonas sp. CFBP 13724]MDY1032281.1 2-amino-4-hydroxy-6-hydroxymethyldihydropteridine diphosphokinase [Stenotrophomonas sp. CFBP8980]
MVRAWIGLGANLGDAASTVSAAIEALDGLAGTELTRASLLYASPAWGNPDQPPFVNAVACVQTDLPPLALLDALLALETGFGRVRDPAVHWGPRLLDLDLLLYGDQVIDLPRLQVPHPYLHQRAFVLVPLAEVAPDLVIPGQGRVRDAVMQVTASGIVPIRR